MAEVMIIETLILRVNKAMPLFGEVLHQNLWGKKCVKSDALIERTELGTLMCGSENSGDMCRTMQPGLRVGSIT